MIPSVTTAGVRPPGSAVVIDGAGRTLLPGLTNQWNAAQYDAKHAFVYEKQRDCGTALKQINPDCLIAMHCTDFPAEVHAALHGRNRSLRRLVGGQHELLRGSQCSA